MNNVRRTLIAALLTLATGPAYSQDRPLTTEIPFAFRASGSDLPAGRYRLGEATQGPRVMELVNIDTGKSAFIRSTAAITESKEARARLIFQCVAGEEGCSLARLWSGDGGGLEFRTPPLKPSQRERRETIYLESFQEK